MPTALVGLLTNEIVGMHPHFWHQLAILRSRLGSSCLSWQLDHVAVSCNYLTGDESNAVFRDRVADLEMLKCSMRWSCMAGKLSAGPITRSLDGPFDASFVPAAMDSWFVVPNSCRTSGPTSIHGSLNTRDRRRARSHAKSMSYSTCIRVHGLWEPKTTTTSKHCTAR